MEIRPKDTPRTITVDGNEAVASVAHRLSETIAIYPITPSSGMGELSDEWSAQGRANLWGVVPEVIEMQSEGGAAGAVHGALTAGSLTTTFTASQGLLLMIPNLYKIAGELLPFCMHVAARTVATHALSIFGDHSDVMACRQIGLAMLASGSVGEAQDFAAIAHSATLRARVPFLHFFDGFRTSHEVSKIEPLSDDDLRFMIDEELVAAHRQRALTPDHPVLRGTAQNPDTYFQAREAVNPFYLACPGIVQETMDRLAARTGRSYHLFDYAGHPAAERVIVIMGSGAETAHETVTGLAARGEKVGVLKVRLFRPWSTDHFLAALPRSVRAIAVLDRTKEPGAVGEPLYGDVVSALAEVRQDGAWPFAGDVRVIGGRYGLSSKEFNPGMVKAVLDELSRPRPKKHFTVGIIDDVTGTSLAEDRELDLEPTGRVEAVFFGLGADGTVGANKNSIKIIGEETPNYAQGYFVYDSKKSGAMTISHLRFGPEPIQSAYLIRRAGFVACHQWGFFERQEMLDVAAPGAVFLVNAPFPPDEVWGALPAAVRAAIQDKGIRLFAIDADQVAQTSGMGGRINSIMQTCFFAISGVLPREEAIVKIKAAIEKTYRKKGAEVVRRNFAAVDATLAQLHEIPVPSAVGAAGAGAAAGWNAGWAAGEQPPLVPESAPDFVQRVTARILAGQGDLLPVSAFPVDGTWPTGTARFEKRNLAREIPVWDSAICIQCNKCALVCPHAAIRAKIYSPAALETAPPTFKAVPFKAAGDGHADTVYTIQVAPEDCTGCTLCVMVCPAKDKSNPRHKAIDMAPQPPLRAAERDNFAFFLDLPAADRTTIKPDVKGSQLLEPLFEFSGACAGCGETPYLKLLTQLFGDRLLMANATGCSSIYGANLPTTPYTVNSDGRGPAWSNSLFEDNGEFGLGMRLALDQHRAAADHLLTRLAPEIGEALVTAILSADQSSEAEIQAQRQRVADLRLRLARSADPSARTLDLLADYLVKKSVWIVGGDGWAYDIGFGGLDHVISTHKNVNILVLDTEVYSNTGGQQSKATPLGASAKFAMAGKATAKKDLGLMAMGYGHVYVARVAFGAKDAQTVRAFLEAESYNGPSLIIAYSHCIAHGYDMAYGAEQQRLAVESGVWPLFRFDPRRITAGEPPLKLDSHAPKIPVKQYMQNETRFRMTEKLDPARYHQLLKWAQRATDQRYAVYEQLAQVTVPQSGAIPAGEPPAGEPLAGESADGEPLAKPAGNGGQATAGPIQEPTAKPNAEPIAEGSRSR